MINDRFKDAPWYTRCTEETIFVIGCGGISSNALYYLTKTIPTTYFVWDMDIIEDINVASQFFSKSQIGQFKVAALKDTVTDFSTAKLNGFNTRYNGEYSPIMITG